MGESAKKREKLKNVVVVVLFLTTILLLNLTWRSENSGGFRLSSVLDLISPDVWVPQPEEFLTADRAVYAFGDDTFAVDRSAAGEALSGILDALDRESRSATLLASEVTPEQYREMLTSFRCLKAEFDFRMPFGEYCERKGVNRSPSFDSIDSFDALMVSDAAPESIFVLDGDLCWRLISDSGEDLAGPLLATLVRKEPVYYTAGSMLGSQNLALLPLTSSNDLTWTTWESEAEDDMEKAGREMAESIFGENFDFVRRITDSFGNVTYMYGYGEKTLTCLASGSFEYKTEPAEQADPGFFASLQEAVAFAAARGGWGSDRRNLNYVLCGSSESGSGRSKQYTFEFAQVLGGVKLQSEDGPAITVQVTGGEVNYYRRAVVNSVARYAGEQQAADAANVLAGNCHLIRSVMDANLLTVSSDEEFSYVAERFRSAEAGYVVTENRLRPAWIITMAGGSRFFFGLYDAAPLGFTRK